MGVDFDLLDAQQAVLYTGALSSSAKLVALAVYSFWSKKSPKPYPGTLTLQRLTGLSKPTVMRAVKELVAAKVLNIETDENVHGQRFVFDLEPVMKLDRSKNNTGQVERHKPVKKRVATGKGRFTNQHQNGSISTEEIQEENHNKKTTKSACADAQRAQEPLRLVSVEPKKPTAFTELKDLYVESYEAARGTKPPFDSRDGKAVKDLLAKCGAETAAAAIRGAFAGFWKDKVTIRSIASEPAKFVGLKATSGNGRGARQPNGGDWKPVMES
ncbi:MAG TPA: helix-turn-helix domain-containing protein [Polyangiaceae bacterium]|jgi:hypothetical protein|nr:helix-turn-helix domain-containing protein [Polyangiaceae bacterium]